jgi:hypothetical protein
MVSMNIFRILGDVSHTLSKCILIWAIHSNKSAEGVSLITQGFYAAVFITRYLDLFLIGSAWNFTLKIFYILSSLYILFLMLRVYARTREREKAWKLGGFCLGGSLIGTPIIMLIFRHKEVWGFMELFWIFSIILESVCVLPQLLLLRQTTVPTVIDSFYLLTLGSYRGFYILNWIWREMDVNDRKPDPVSIIFGVVQTAFYVDFAWVYYTRQRVKLRNGGVVDNDDMSRGWLLSKIFGSKPLADEEENAPALYGHDDTERPGPKRNGSSRWGSRGISVSADDGVMASESERQQHDGFVDPDAKMRDPDELAKILEDDDDDNGSEDGILPAHGGVNGSTGVGNGAEWREGQK